MVGEGKGDVSLTGRRGEREAACVRVVSVVVTAGPSRPCSWV